MLSAIAVAEPSSAALLLQECLEKLAAQVQQLTAASAPHASSPRGIRDADDSSTTMRLLKDSVLGFANGAAALVSAATRYQAGLNLPCPCTSLCPSLEMRVLHAHLHAQ